MTDPGADLPPGVRVRVLDGVPDLLALHRLDPARYPFLLESAAAGTPQARHDLLLAFPGRELRLTGAALDAPAGSAGAPAFLDALDGWWQQERLAEPSPEVQGLPFAGGWFLYLGYELAAWVEPRLQALLPRPEAGATVALARRCPAAVVRDRRTGRCLLVSEEDRDCTRRLELMREDARRASRGAPSATPAAGPVAGTLTEDPAEEFLAGVSRVRRYIREGDVFQVNLSRGWHLETPAPVDPGDLYVRLRQENPAPFAGIARLGDQTIVSSSPERLVRVAGDRIETRPIAGTRRRDRDRRIDRDLGRELIAHPKERAEHVMLIDLERNDLGRVCRPGTVEVDELMVLERYAHVHHIVSNVRGRLRGGVGPGAVVRALFPGGTITGCPKVRCMEIIAELEQRPRGAYTGSMGYLDRRGRMDLNILIRTLVASPAGLAWRAGAGIVADSVPGAELEETRAKARGLLRALGRE